MKQNTLTWNPCWQSEHWGTEAGGSQVLGQTELHREVKVILGYKVRLCLKQKEENGIQSFCTWLLFPEVLVVQGVLWVYGGVCAKCQAD